MKKKDKDKFRECFRQLKELALPEDANTPLASLERLFGEVRRDMAAINRRQEGTLRQLEAVQENNSVLAREIKEMDEALVQADLVARRKGQLQRELAKLKKEVGERLYHFNVNTVRGFVASRYEVSDEMLCEVREALKDGKLIGDLGVRVSADKVFALFYWKDEKQGEPFVIARVFRGGMEAKRWLKQKKEIIDDKGEAIPSDLVPDGMPVLMDMIDLHVEDDPASLLLFGGIERSVAWLLLEGAI